MTTLAGVVNGLSNLECLSFRPEGRLLQHQGLVVLVPDHATASLTAFTGRALTIFRAGFALKVVGSLVNGLIP